jgi:hypothetical protein
VKKKKKKKKKAMVIDDAFLSTKIHASKQLMYSKAIGSLPRKTAYVLKVCFEKNEKKTYYLVICVSKQRELQTIPI